MHIGELARRAGIATSAIRYYEAAGILPRAARKSGRRVYGEDAVTRLKFVRIAQATGFSLAETRELFQASDRDGWRPPKFEQLVERKIEEIDAKLVGLRRMRDFLEAGISCRCHGPDDCRLFAQSSIAQD